MEGMKAMTIPDRISLINHVDSVFLLNIVPRNGAIWRFIAPDW
jgi:hypothetical protein